MSGRIGKPRETVVSFSAFVVAGTFERADCVIHILGLAKPERNRKRTREVS